MQKSYNDMTWGFLVASPSLGDSIFEESVVLVLEDGPEGSFGLILNKPHPGTLGDLSPEFDNEYLSNVGVFCGGPVGGERLTLALWAEGNSSAGNFSFGLTPDRVEEILRANPDAKVCAFVGCSMWAKNQLKSEIDEGSWIVSRADISSIFGLEPSEIWAHMLMREVPKYRELPVPSVKNPMN